MPIIQPNKNDKKINLFIFGMTAATIIIAVWGVFIYNQLINLRHEVIRQENKIQKAEVLNAELKNNLYQLTDTKNLETSANQNNLVLEKKPQYVKKEQIAKLQD